MFKIFIGEMNYVGMACDGICCMILLGIEEAEEEEQDKGWDGDWTSFGYHHGYRQSSKYRNRYLWKSFVVVLTVSLGV